MVTVNALVWCLALLSIPFTLASEWGYPAEADEDFPKWGGMCDSGTHQSPVNLVKGKALKGIFDKLDLDNYDDKQTDTMLVNNGHTVQLYGFTTPMKLSGGPLLSDYVVEQIHFHWWSEHTIDSTRYPLEAHIVHRNTRYPNATVASNHKDGLAVVAVFFHVSNERNDAIQMIVEHLDEVKSYEMVNKPVHVKKPFVVRDLFPKFDSYMSYSGSLTTPPCAEALTFIVVTQTFPVTLEQVEHFKEIQYKEGAPLLNNYRNLQKLNNRPIVVALVEESRSAASPVQVSFTLMPLWVMLVKYLL